MEKEIPYNSQEKAILTVVCSAEKPIVGSGKVVYWWLRVQNRAGERQ